MVSKRADGYHNLETIFYPVGLTDALEISLAAKTEFTSSGIAIDGKSENNLVYKAYQLLERQYKLPPLKLHLHKVIPFGAGLGGGSSDAAFTLQMLNSFFDLRIPSPELEKYAAQIGADCPFFIYNKACFAKGIGDQLEPIELDLSDYKIVIIKPEASVSTPEAYRNIVPQKPAFQLKDIVHLPIEEWKETIRNDFEESVFPAYPEIAQLKDILYKNGALYASMSGSGSAVFGIFRHLPTNLDNFIPKGIFTYR